MLFPSNELTFRSCAMDIAPALNSNAEPKCMTAHATTALGGAIYIYAAIQRASEQRWHAASGHVPSLLHRGCSGIGNDARSRESRCRLRMIEGLRRREQPHRDVVGHWEHFTQKGPPSDVTPCFEP